MKGYIKSKYSIEDLEEFRDVDGFIDLSEAGIEINAESREQRGTTERIKNWIDLNGTKYLIRGSVVENYGMYAELIVEEMAKKLGIETAHYDLMKIKDENGEEQLGVLSESMLSSDDEELVSLYDLVGDDNIEYESIEEKNAFIDKFNYDAILDRLRNRFEKMGMDQETIEKNISNYEKRLLFNLAVSDYDKHPNNVSFISSKSDDNAFRLAPNYDSEASLGLSYIVENISECIMDADLLETNLDADDPKIAVYKSKEDGGWDIIWRDTFERMIENKEIAEYYMNDINGKIDMKEIFSIVEDRINASLPFDVRIIAQEAYEYKNNIMNKIIAKEISPLDDISMDKREETENEIQILSFLKGLNLNKSIRKEMNEFGEAIEFDKDAKDGKDDKDGKDLND